MSYDEHLISMAGGDGDALDLDAIQARADAATEGPWETTMSNDDYPPITYGVITSSHGDTVAELADDVRASIQEGPMSTGSADSWFIAHARTDVPALLALVRELENKLGWVAAVAADLDISGARIEAQGSNGSIYATRAEGRGIGYREAARGIRAALEPKP